MSLVDRLIVGLSMCVLLAGCGPQTQHVQIEFAAAFGDQALRCGDDGRAQLTDLRFYVQDVMLVSEDGSEVTLEFGPTSQWQHDSVVLLDLENGSGDCVNGSSASNAIISGKVPVGDYEGLRFTVGVPSDLNHADPLLAAPPLTLSAMHWHWRSGYKFLRAGITYDDDGYWLHLGSARCHGVIGNLQGCESGNRPQVVLESYRASENIVVFDFERLLADVDLQDERRQSCQMGPDEQACVAVLGTLGLDVVTGDSIVSSSVFRVIPRP